MTKLFSFIALVCLFACTASKPTVQTTKGIEPALTSASQWFQAWELVCKDVYKTNTLNPVKLVFFDEKYVYTTSEISGKGGEIVVGPTLFNQPWVWYKKAHNGQLTMPNSSTTDVKVMSFTNTLIEGKDTSTYFVTPLPSYWKLKDIGDHGVGYDSLALIVFLHEFTHSQQIVKANAGMDDIIGGYLMAHPEDERLFSDDMMQDMYEKNEDYVKSYQIECTMFENACAEKDKAKQKSMLKEALSLLDQRQKRLLAQDKRDLAEIDNYWLTLEGTAQYTTYAWLMHPKGGNFDHKRALKVIKTRSWSQEEGFAISLALSKYVAPDAWTQVMFCRNPVSSVALLKEALK
jgi:hypothetical protein